MARIDFDGMGGHGVDAADQRAVIKADNAERIELPDSSYIADSDIARDGADLVLTNNDGQSLVIEGYFSHEEPPVLSAPHGGVLTPSLVQSFVQTEGPLQYAAAGNQAHDESPVGTISEINGTATVTRTDGSQETLSLGSPIYQGDIVETDGKSAVNITFSDESSFAVSQNARLAIDEYVFDPASESGTQDFSLLRGVFVYTSGLIGREDPDDVQIETPVGSIGIRGTIIAGNINPQSESQITVVEGAIVVKNGTGEVTLSNQFESIRVGGFNSEIQTLGVLDQKAVADSYNVLRTVSPDFFVGVEKGIDAQTEGASDTQTSPSESREGASSESGNNGETKAGSETTPETDPESKTAPEIVPETKPETFDGGSKESFDGTDTAFKTVAETMVKAEASAPAPAASSAPPATQTVVTAAPAPAVIEPTHVNRGPVVRPGMFSIDENSAAGATVGSIIASDPENDRLTYSITGGTGASLFYLDGTQVKVMPGANLDYESQSSYTLTVNVSDGKITVPQTFTVNIGNVNEAPIVTGGTFNVNENSAGHTVVGNIIASDPENGHLTYSITGGTGENLFYLDGGQVKVNPGASLDYESQSSYTLTVNVSDGNSIVPQSFVINIGNANEAPVVTAGTFSIDENSAANSVVGSIVASDPENDSLSYSIAGGTGASLFYLDGSQIKVLNGATLNHEAQSSYTLTVNVSDGNITTPQTFVINIGDVNEAPAMANGSLSFNENLNVVATKANIRAAMNITDPDAGDTLTYTIAQDTADLFQFDGQGNLVLKNNARLDYETDNRNYSIVIRVTDSQGLQTTATLALALGDVNEIPTIQQRSVTIAEDPTLYTSGYILTRNDLDVSDPEGDIITYTLKSSPAHGNLQYFNGTAWVNLSVNASFTSSDIENDKIRYVGTTLDNTTDVFNFQVTDGHTTLPTTQFNINITPDNIIEASSQTVNRSILNDIVTINGNYNIVNTHTGDDVIRILGVQNIINSGAGNDTIIVSNTAFGSIDGNTGHDILKLDAQSTVYDFATGYNPLKLQAIEEIVLAKSGQHLKLHSADITSLANESQPDGTIHRVTITELSDANTDLGGRFSINNTTSTTWKIEFDGIHTEILPEHGNTTHTYYDYRIEGAANKILSVDKNIDIIEIKNQNNSETFLIQDDAFTTPIDGGAGVDSLFLLEDGGNINLGNVTKVEQFFFKNEDQGMLVSKDGLLALLAQSELMQGNVKSLIFGGAGTLSITGADDPYGNDLAAVDIDQDGSGTGDTHLFVEGANATINGQTYDVYHYMNGSTVEGSVYISQDVTVSLVTP